MRERFNIFAVEGVVKLLTTGVLSVASTIVNVYLRPLIRGSVPRCFCYFKHLKLQCINSNSGRNNSTSYFRENFPNRFLVCHVVSCTDKI